MNSSPHPATLPVLPQTREVVTEIPGPRSQKLLAERRQEVPDSIGVHLPVFIERADGGILLDVDGNRIIDLATGLGPTALGAANARVRERVREQLDRFTHTCFMSTEYESYVAVCRWLNTHAPGDFEKRTALFTTGAEANENAVKIARYATGRRKILAFDGSYHGRTYMTMSLSSKEHPYKSGFGPFSDDVLHTAVPSSPRTAEDSVESHLEQVRRTLAENDPSSFAAMIIEPVLGEAGCLIPHPGFLAGLRSIADEHCILLVVDEVQCGMGRTGRLFAIEHEGVVPDLLVTAKALANGMPLSAVTGRADIMDAVHVSGLGGTYTGNPLSCEAALAVFEQLESGEVFERATRLGDIALDLLRPLAGSGLRVIDVRARGAMIGIEFGDERTLEPDSALAKAVSRYCHSHGVLALTNGTFENVIRLLPPLIIEEDLFRDGIQVIISGIREAAKS